MLGEQTFLARSSLGAQQRRADDANLHVAVSQQRSSDGPAMWAVLHPPQVGIRRGERRVVRRCDQHARRRERCGDVGHPGEGRGKKGGAFRVLPLSRDTRFGAEALCFVRWGRKRGTG